ncbi:MAG: carboxy-S-adenosyl-L-methionine synthase CmoA [Bdellovibrionota bacterium]|nr:MAG: carboxy-S-adenosyl-L-methionine synthase CmoA [Pseudomonadota bacterium]
MDQSRVDLKLISQNDNIFAGRHYPKPFAFNHEVAEVFDDMVQRSIPMYRDVTRFTADWVLHFYQSGTSIIDIGCSTGTTTHQIAHRLSEPAAFMAIDSSEAMIRRAEEKLSDLPLQHKLHLMCNDVMAVSLPKASAVVINYTLQFLPVSQRKLLLQRIYEALVPGGIILISEKVRHGSPAFQELGTQIYEDFKERQGYSRTEIEKKKEALENVLIPFTEAEHRKLLEESGFTAVESVMKWNTFMTLVAQKGY